VLRATLSAGKVGPRFDSVVGPAALDRASDPSSAWTESGLTPILEAIL
jgi:hypothetical protein